MNCTKCQEEIFKPRKKYCADCAKYIGRTTNLIYGDRKRSDCGNRLTNEDIYRRNRILTTPGTQDCELCEIGRIRSLENKK